MKTLIQNKITNDHLQHKQILLQMKRKWKDTAMGKIKISEKASLCQVALKLKMASFQDRTVRKN